MYSRTVKWIGGGFEAFLGFPVIGASFILGLFWMPLFVMGVFHVAALVLAIYEKKVKAGHILGIITSFVAIIPFVGMLMHMATAVVLLFEASKNR